MTDETKAKIMYEHLLTDKTCSVLMKELGIYSDFIKCLKEVDFNRIVDDNIYFSAIFGPASNSRIKVAVPVSSKVISFDVNILIKCNMEERIAVLLHEMGHAMNPLIKGDNGEFIADDFAISRGYGSHIKSSLETYIKILPDEFNKPISFKRIERIK